MEFTVAISLESTFHICPWQMACVCTVCFVNTPLHHYGRMPTTYPAPALVARFIKLIFLLVSTSGLPYQTFDKTLEKVTKGCWRECSSLETLRTGQTSICLRWLQCSSLNKTGHLSQPHSWRILSKFPFAVTWEQRTARLPKIPEPSRGEVRFCETNWEWFCWEWF